MLSEVYLYVRSQNNIFVVQLDGSLDPFYYNIILNLDYDNITISKENVAII